MVSDLDSSSCRLPASDMLRTRSVRMRCLLSSEKMPTKVSQPVKLFMFSNSVPNTLVASSSPMIRSAMLPSITFCCLMHVLDAGVLDVEIGGADLLVGLGDLVQHGAGLLDLGAHFLHDLFGLRDLGIEILKCRHEFLRRHKVGLREYRWGT